MMTFKRHLVAALLGLVLVCLAGVGGLTWRNLQAATESEQRETRTREVIQQLGNLLSSLKDAETGQRGFIITGKPDYLEPYQASLAEIAIGQADLHRLTADNPRQQQRLDAITPLVAAKLADLKVTIAMRETQGFPAASAAVATQSGRKIMDEIRALVAQAQAEEAQLLKERVATHAANNRRATQSVTLGSVLGGLALLLLFIRLRWEQASRQRAQALVAQQAAELVTLYAAAPVGLFLYDTDLRYVRVNPAMAKLNGLPAEQHIGRTLRELLAPELADAVEPQVRQVLATGQPLLNCEVHGATAPRSDEQQRHWLVSYHPVQAGDGTIRGVQGAVQEITERKQAEDALRDSEAFSRSIIKSSQDCIKVLDLEGNLLSMESGQELLGIEDIRPFLNKSWIDFWESEKDQQAAQAALASAAAGEAGSFVGFFRTLRGESRWWDVVISPILDATGKPARLLAVSRDVTERAQAEDALRESEQRFRAMVLASSDLICRMNPDWSEMLQIYDKDFVVNSHVANPNWLQHYVHRDDQPQLIAAVNDAIRTKSAFEMEHRVRRADGSWGWMLSRSVPLLDAKGDITEWFGTGSDVTEHKRAEQALRESEERYRNLFNSIDEGFCIIEMIYDEHEKPVDYRFLEVNPAFEKQTGMLGVTGKRVREIIPDLEESWFEIYGEVARTGEPVRFTHETRKLNRWLDVHAARLGGPETRQVAVIFDNITERKKSEEALRVSEERFRAFFDRGPIAIYSCDAAGMFQECNPSAVQLWGRKPQRGDGDDRFSGSYKLYLPDGTFVPRAQRPMAAVLTGNIAGLFDQEYIIERPDGSRISIIANTVPLKNERGQISGGMCCFYDITERSRLRQETLEQAQALAELDRRKDEFLAMLSHELRNPLAAISNAVQLLRLQKEEGTIQKHAHGIIKRQVGQLQNLVDDLLEVSRINTGRVRLRQKPVSASGIVERAVETAQPLMAQRRHQFDVLLPQQAVFLHADAARLEQVLVNLLTNAAKYTDEGGRIWLSVETADAAEAAANGAAALPMVVIRVRDTGIGIAPELLPRIFDLFTQADRSLDRSQGGLGIGLCLVQRLVEMHGGSVEAHSVLGQGSEFVVRLPVLQPTLPMACLPVPDTAARPAQASIGCRVLVVDDNVDAAQGMARLLEMTGYEARLAYDGPSALAAVMDYRPDVVLLDIGLPGLDGYEVAQQVRQQAALGSIVLVALTGYGQDTDRQRSQDAGFDHHLVKPASFSQIENILLSVSERVT